MKSNPNRTLISSCFKRVFVATLLGLWFSLTAMVHFNAKLLPRPISPALASGPTVITPTNIFALYAQSKKTDATSIFINTIPHSDGTQVDVYATGIEASGPVILFVDPGENGPAGHRCLDALTLDGGHAFTATIRGFAPSQDIGDGDDTMEITATVQSGLVHTGKIEFRRAFVEPTAGEVVNIDNGNFTIDMPNLNTFNSDTYMMVMSTNASPGPPPNGFTLASSTYQMNPSGGIFESEKIITLKLRYPDPLPNDADPHTVSVLGWNSNNNTWLNLGGDLFSDDQQLVYVTKRLRIYALATTPTWRDTFKESSRSGIATSQNVGPGPGGVLILSTGQTSGTVTSIPITTTTNTTHWDSVSYNAITSSITHIHLDLLGINDDVILENASNGADISSLPVATYPSLKLRATFTTSTVGNTPSLDEWSLSWQPTTIQLPSLTTLSPVSATNNIATTITVTGSNFVTGTQIRLGSSYTLPTTFVSSTVIIGLLEAGIPPRNYNLTVTNPDGQLATLPNSFSLALPPQSNKPVYLPMVIK